MKNRVACGIALCALLFAVPAGWVSCGDEESIDGGVSRHECDGKANGDPCSAGVCVMLGDEPACAPECTIPGETCELSETAGACYNTGKPDRHACLDVGSKAKGEACAALNECAAGMACLSPEDPESFRCHEVCNVDCAEGTCTDTGLGFSVCAS